ncbi:hypothetical protein GF360_01070 [candidate division WWE3 bacterium]|nr:hypothetical protein [candidate division WWE3 bacterium]
MPTTAASLGRSRERGEKIRFEHTDKLGYERDGDVEMRHSFKPDPEVPLQVLVGTTHHGTRNLEIVQRGVDPTRENGQALGHLVSDEKKGLRWERAKTGRLVGSCDSEGAISSTIVVASEKYPETLEADVSPQTVLKYYEVRVDFEKDPFSDAQGDHSKRKIENYHGERTKYTLRVTEIENPVLANKNS